MRLEKQAENWAIHDELTGLYNRNYLKVKGAEQLKGAIMPITIIMGDCNYLKRVNDAYGHEYGDLLLQAGGPGDPGKPAAGERGPADGRR